MKIDCLHWITSIVPVLLKAPHHPFFPPLLNICNCRSRGIFCKYNGRKYNVCKGQISWANAHSLEADLVKRPDAYHFLCTIKDLAMWEKALCYSLSRGLTDLCSPVSQYITNPIKLGLMKQTCKTHNIESFRLITGYHLTPRPEASTGVAESGGRVSVLAPENCSIRRLLYRWFCWMP